MNDESPDLSKGRAWYESIGENDIRLKLAADLEEIEGELAQLMTKLPVHEVDGMNCREHCEKAEEAANRALNLLPRLRPL